MALRLMLSLSSVGYMSGLNPVYGVHGAPHTKHQALGLSTFNPSMHLVGLWGAEPSYPHKLEWGPSTTPFYPSTVQLGPGASPS